jgi:hypothetical protein
VIRNRKATGLLLGALIGLGPLALASRAEAGIIITKEGKVIVGRIVKDEMSDEGVKVHWPYKERRERGVFFFERNRIRWCDADLDEPSTAYWDQYTNDPIDPAWLPARDRYLESKKNKLDPNLKLFLDSMRDSNPHARLTAMSIPFKMGNSVLNIRKPEGWVRDESVNGMLMLISDTKGEEGFVPRIHIWSVTAAPVQPSDQVGWLREEFEHTAVTSDAYETRDSEGPKPGKGGGFDFSIQTTIRRQGAKPVTALRQVFFRTNRTYFYVAYAHEKDFDKYGMFFRACLQSIQIDDGGGSGGAAPGGDQKPGDKPGDGAAPGGDQKPGDKPAGDAKPADKPAGDAKPADKPAGDAKPADKPAGDAKPADKPAGDAKPADKPAATKPADATKPTGTKPAGAGGDKKP